VAAPPDRSCAFPAPAALWGAIAQPIDAADWRITLSLSAGQTGWLMRSEDPPERVGRSGHRDKLGAMTLLFQGAETRSCRATVPAPAARIADRRHTVDLPAGSFTRNVGPSPLRTKQTTGPRSRAKGHFCVDPARPTSIIHAPCPCGGIGRRA
jgi:hypothetical protein